MSLEFVKETFQNFHIDPKRTLTSIANNHAGDKKEEGVRQTVQNLTNLGCHVIGCASVNKYILKLLKNCRKIWEL